MQGDISSKAAVKYHHHRLPHQLHGTNTPKVTTYLWYQHDGLPGGILHKSAVLERRLDQIYHLIPVGGVRCLHLRLPEILQPFL